MSRRVLFLGSVLPSYLCGPTAGRSEIACFPDEAACNIEDGCDLPMVLHGRYAIRPAAIFRPCPAVLEPWECVGLLESVNDVLARTSSPPITELLNETRSPDDLHELLEALLWHKHVQVAVPTTYATPPPPAAEVFRLDREPWRLSSAVDLFERHALCSGPEGERARFVATASRIDRSLVAERSLGNNVEEVVEAVVYRVRSHPHAYYASVQVRNGATQEFVANTAFPDALAAARSADACAELAHAAAHELEERRVSSPLTGWPEDDASGDDSDPFV